MATLAAARGVSSATGSAGRWLRRRTRRGRGDRSAWLGRRCGRRGGHRRSSNRRDCRACRYCGRGLDGCGLRKRYLCTRHRRERRRRRGRGRLGRYGRNRWTRGLSRYQCRRYGADRLPRSGPAELAPRNAEDDPECTETSNQTDHRQLSQRKRSALWLGRGPRARQTAGNRELRPDAGGHHGRLRRRRRVRRRRQRSEASECSERAAAAAHSRRAARAPLRDRSQALATRRRATGFVGTTGSRNSGSSSSVRPRSGIRIGSEPLRRARRSAPRTAAVPPVWQRCRRSRQRRAFEARGRRGDRDRRRRDARVAQRRWPAWPDARGARCGRSSWSTRRTRTV